MSLRKLLRWHYWTLQTNDCATPDKSGAFDRRSSWLITNLNLRGNVQATATSSNAAGKDDTIILYGMREVLLFYTIFHNYDNIVFSPSNRILVHIDPRQKIEANCNTIVTAKENIRVFEFLSAREPVALRGKKKLFELYIKQTYRQSL